MHLRALKNLVQLQISPVFLNDSAFAFFGQMTNLKIIDHHSGAGYVVANPAVTDQGLAALLQNTSLEYLSLQNMSHITDAGFAHFRNMRNLKALYTAGWLSITDDAILSLENCTALEELHFVSSNISDKGLANLLLLKDKLVNLKRLYVYQSKTTVPGVMSFQQNWGRPIDVRYL